MILLDTHAWVWWLSQPEKLSRTAKQAIARNFAARAIGVSSFSVWEVALLAARGRLRLAVDLESWLAASERLPGLTFHPVTNAIALQSVSLPGEFHSDPADRIIVATARHLGAELVTGDQKIRGYRHVKTTW